MLIAFIITYLFRTGKIEQCKRLLTSDLYRYPFRWGFRK
ncbi:hypothetical protein PBAL39_22180 [Pedobacter sp. BAL39]|nr:hypothetical protein PBAL39_22180 [Pedobacter sp. BAL39]